MIEYCLDLQIDPRVPILAAGCLDRYFDKHGCDQMLKIGENLSLPGMCGAAILSLNLNINNSKEGFFQREDFIERILSTHEEIDLFNKSQHYEDYLDHFANEIGSHQNN
jgi:hypothetical protein